MGEFLRFSLRPLREHSVEQLHRWRNEFLTREIDPIITLASRELIDCHRRAGDTLMIITATNSFVTAPIAERLGIDHLIATIPEISMDVTPVRSRHSQFPRRQGRRLQIWLDEHAQDLGKSSFYSDSHNDIPLLELVDNPVAVDPDEELAQAVARNWPVISLRSPLAHGMAPA